MATIDKNERKTIDKIFKEFGDRVVGGAVRLYQGINHSWRYVNIFGIIVSYQKEYALYVGIYDLNTKGCLFEHELCKDVEWKPGNKNFMFFEGDRSHFGFLFASEDEFRDFFKQAMKLKPKKPSFLFGKKTPVVIGSVESFRQDIGFSSQGDSMEGSIHPSIVDVLRSFGIKKKDVLEDPDIFQFLLKISMEFSPDVELPPDKINVLSGMVERLMKHQNARRQQRQKNSSGCEGGCGNTRVEEASHAVPPSPSPSPRPFNSPSAHPQYKPPSTSPSSAGGSGSGGRRMGPPALPKTGPPPPVPPRGGVGVGCVPPPLPPRGNKSVAVANLRPPLVELENSNNNSIHPLSPLGTETNADRPPPPPCITESSSNSGVPLPPPLVAVGGGNIPPPPPLVSNEDRLRTAPSPPTTSALSAPSPSPQSLLGGIVGFDMSRLKKTEPAPRKETVTPQNKMAAQLLAVLEARRKQIHPVEDDEDSDDDDDDDDWGKKKK